jgi:glycosyltransferase involved in cell wall biosynthesis
LARLFGKKILFWGHGWTRRDKGIKKWVRQMFYRLPNGFLYYGKTGRDIGVEFGFDENRAFVINNSQEMLGHRPLSHTARRKIKEQFFAEPVKPVVICSTRLAKRKKLHLLVEAIGLLEPSLRPNLILVGDGPERDRLKGLSNSLGVNCYMPGACYDEETLRDMFSCATVSVCPAAVGLTAIHSMNYGVPMLTDDCFERHGPEFEAIIPGRTGDFFEAGSIDAMASAIAKWTKNEFAEDDICSSCVNLVNDYYSPEFQEKMIIEAVQELSSE